MGQTDPGQVPAIASKSLLWKLGDLTPIGERISHQAVSDLPLPGTRDIVASSRHDGELDDPRHRCWWVEVSTRVAAAPFVLPGP